MRLARCLNLAPFTPHITHEIGQCVQNQDATAQLTGAHCTSSETFAVIRTHAQIANKNNNRSFQLINHDGVRIWPRGFA